MHLKREFHLEKMILIIPKTKEKLVNETKKTNRGL